MPESLNRGKCSPTAAPEGRGKATFAAEDLPKNQVGTTGFNSKDGRRPDGARTTGSGSGRQAGKLLDVLALRGLAKWGLGGGAKRAVAGHGAVVLLEGIRHGQRGRDPAVPCRVVRRVMLRTYPQVGHVHAAGHGIADRASKNTV
jgi:hypothetical protein